MRSLLRRNRTTIGLDIGSGSIKVAVIDHSGPEPEVTRLGQAALRADAIVEGEILDSQLVADTVRGLLSELALASRQVVTSVGGRDLIVKKLQLDRMQPEDVREVIRWEAEQHVPFDMENVELDFQILNPLGDGLQMDVLLVAAKRELVEQRLALLNDAQLKAAIIDVDAFALHNAFGYNYPEAMTSSVVLVNVGHEISTVNVLQDGVPVLTRDLTFGSRRLREELRRMHDLSDEEADAVVHGRSERQRDFVSLLAEACEELAVGVERAVAFLSIGSPERLPGRAYLCGGGVRIPGLVGTVADRLRVRTEIANPFERLRLRAAAAQHFPLEGLAPMMMLAVGLALRSSS
jgi:type IV pilus assembly protein PilM